MSNMNGSMPNGHLAMKGKNQGDMSPVVEDFQAPMKDFAEAGFSKTLDYIERQDKMRAKEVSGLKKQSYTGRYS